MILMAVLDLLSVAKSRVILVFPDHMEARLDPGIMRHTVSSLSCPIDPKFLANRLYYRFPIILVRIEILG